MGVCGGKQSSTNNNQTRVRAPSNQRQQMINQQLSQFIRIDHPLNVNHKYTSYFKIIPDQFVGDGIKKTNQYTSRLSKGEWMHKREEFWETRIEGRLESWNTIKIACEAGESDAIAILDAGDLKLVNKSIQILYDGQGFKYDIPIFCINEPVQFPLVPSTEVGLTQIFDQGDIKITIRGVKFAKDLTFLVSKTMLIQEIKGQILENQKELGILNVRLFYSGREMQLQYYKRQDSIQ